ncbi:cupin domain-containing protein [Mongoliimonas terrestris]|uniref:cupin domain-containing protein n=1 Tax=Mongoliimonas terrestris TaxID=1709001 RepID=UPI000949A256|nr:cupin domain-containing protein [Mongoliimonas terrestris]
MAKYHDDLFTGPEGNEWTPTEPGIRRQILVQNDQMMMVRVTFEKGAVGSLHNHPHIQASLVEDGAFEVTIEGRTERLEKGGTFIVPTNAMHGVVALEPGALIDVFTPRREEFLG